jgi:hypothetical protein
MSTEDTDGVTSYLGCGYPKVGIPSGAMQESMHDFVVNGLQASKGTWPAIAEATGISKRTIEKIASREIEDPGVSHIEKLANYFRAQVA